MNLYLDSSALVKRYVAEPGSELVRDTMQEASGWYICRIGFVETMWAVRVAAGARGARTVRDEWPSFGIVEVDQELVEHAAELTAEHDLRSLDALHLAAALLLSDSDLVFATWDGRQHAAAQAERLPLLPEALARP